MAAAGPSRDRSRSPGGAADSATLQAGCNVRLHGLKGAAELNGLTGVLDAFVDASGRWRVKLSSGQMKDLKPDNLEKIVGATPVPSQPAAQVPSQPAAQAAQQKRPAPNLLAGSKVKIYGLKGAVTLNGQEGVLDNFVIAKGRWRVKMKNGECKDLKPENLEDLEEPEIMFDIPEGALREGSKVTIVGLKGAPELNGQQGILDLYVNTTSRWRVKLDNGQSKDLKPENIQAVEPEVVVAAAEIPQIPPKPVEAAPVVAEDPAAAIPAAVPETSWDKQGWASKRGRPQQMHKPAQRRAVSSTPAKQVEETVDLEIGCEYSWGDSPGYYIISPPGARVNSGASLNAPKVGEISPGTRVEVLEVVTPVDVKRLRARVAFPYAGWISLVNLEDGHRFAVRDESNQITTTLKGPSFRGDAIDLQAGERCGPDDRLIISEFIGEGAYSTVWVCRDSFKQVDYALKFTRDIEKTRRALMREIKLMGALKERADKDDEGTKSLLVLADGFSEAFEFKGRLGSVTEAMKYNLLTCLRRHGAGKGLPLLPTVRNFTQNIFQALRVMRRASLLHLDVKPENLLVSRDGASVKLADFGCTLTSSEAEKCINEDMMPRFYRAPEVILGQKLTTQIDMWSAAATIYQMATDRFLFSGDTNNAVLHEMLQICGAYPVPEAPAGVIPLPEPPEGECAKKHFDDAGDFLLHPTPSAPSLRTVPMTSFSTPARPIRETLKALLVEVPQDIPADRHEILLGHFGDVLYDCLKLVPGSRSSPQEALNHRFFGRGAGDLFADLDALWAQAGNKDKLDSISSQK